MHEQGSIHRQPLFPIKSKESDAAWTAFRTYAGLGPARSLESLRGKLGLKSARHLERWSATFGWVERVRSYDGALAERQEQARLRAIEAEAERWATRRGRQREADWALASALRNKAAEILKRSLEDSGTRWTLSDAARFAKIAADLGRLACELPTEVHAVSGPGGGPLQVERQASVDQVAEILAILDAAGALGPTRSGLLREVEAEDSP